MDSTAEWGSSAAVATKDIEQHWELGSTGFRERSAGASTTQLVWTLVNRENDYTPVSDSDLSRRGYAGPPVARFEFIELIEPFGPVFEGGGGDCVGRSKAFSIPSFSAAGAEVPSEV